MFLEIQHDEIRKTMKNLLFILALLPGLAFAASSDSLYWTNAAADNDMNNPANYTEGDAGGAAAEIAATDTLFFATGSAAATASGDISVANVVTTAGYSGAWSIKGYTLTTSTNGPAFDHTGTLHLGNGITCNGASGTFHVGAGVGTVTATSCVLTMNGTTGMVLDADKAITIKQQVNGNSSVVTASGSAALNVTNSGTPLVIGTNAIYTVNATIYYKSTASSTLYNIGAGTTISGTVKLQFFMQAATGSTCTAPALTTNNVGIFISDQSTSRSTELQLSGNINVGTKTIEILKQVGAATLTFSSGNFSVSGGTFNCGSLSATGIFVAYFGSSVVSITSFLSTYNTNASTINFQSASWSCSGNWTFGSNHTINPGTSIVTLNGTGAQTITSAGNLFYDLTVNNSGTAFVVLADSLTANDLTLTDGPFNAASYGISAVDLIHASQDSTRFQSLWLSGDFTRGALADKCDTAGQHIRFSAGASHTMAAAGKTYARVTTSGPLTITGGATIATLSYGIDGIPITIATGTTLTAGTVSIGGTTEAPDTLQGAGAGATLDLTGNQTVTWADPVYVKDMALAAGDTVTLTTGIDGGGNTGAWIFPSSATNRRNRGWLGLGVWIMP
jgi:hypothetical protein